MTLQQIKDAVEAGQFVYYTYKSNPLAGAMRVVKTKRGEFLIKGMGHGGSHGLTQMDGVTVNGDLEQFSIGEPALFVNAVLANGGSDFYVDGSNVARWKSNKHVPPKEVLSEFREAGLIDSQIEATSDVARDVDTAAFVAEYRKVYKGPSAEEISEMRANFAPGSVVVNVLTGHRTQL